MAKDGIPNTYTVLEWCGMQDTKSAATPLLARYMHEAAAQDTAIDLEL